MTVGAKRTEAERKHLRSSAVRRSPPRLQLDLLVLPENAKEPPDFDALLRSLPRFKPAEAQSLRKAIANERAERRRHFSETRD